jgi:hypothetical protein
MGWGVRFLFLSMDAYNNYGVASTTDGLRALDQGETGDRLAKATIR